MKITCSALLVLAAALVGCTGNVSDRPNDNTAECFAAARCIQVDYCTPPDAGTNPCQVLLGDAGQPEAYYVCPPWNPDPCAPSAD